MKYDPRIHHRRSIRLQDYDYSQSGAYFVTICTDNRELLLMNNDIQVIVQSTWSELPERFTNLSLDEFIIMPNHVHGILVLNGPDECEYANVRQTGPTLAAVVGAFKIYLGNRRPPGSGPVWIGILAAGLLRTRYPQRRGAQPDPAVILDNPAKWADDPNNPENIRQQTSTVRRRRVLRADAGAGQAHAPTM